jgi:general secretion pathway protein H
MQRSMRGFTLIEIMLVMVIIGCAAGIVVLSIPGGPNPKLGSDLAEESQQLAATIQVMSEQATQQGRTIGLHISEHGYQFMIRQENAPATDENVTQTTSKALDTRLDWDHQAWQPYQSEKMHTAGEFDQQVALTLTLDGLQLQDEENRLGRSEPQWFDTENQLSAKAPQILLLPSGEITPFSLTLQKQGSSNTEFRQITGQENGQIDVQTTPTQSPTGGHA